jgi:hypothetical protein
MTDFQAAKEASSPRKRRSSTLKHETSSPFSFLEANFCLPEPLSQTQLKILKLLLLL